MMTVAQMHQRLDEIIQHAPEGQSIVVTIGNEIIVVASPLKAAKRKVVRLGARLIPNYVPSEGFWDPLPEEELKLWEGGE